MFKLPATGWLAKQMHVSSLKNRRSGGSSSERIYTGTSAMNVDFGIQWTEKLSLFSFHCLPNIKATLSTNEWDNNTEVLHLQRMHGYQKQWLSDNRNLAEHSALSDHILMNKCVCFVV